jgi:hypothetical protein
MQSKVTVLGTLELSCICRDNMKGCMLEYNVRVRAE